jgi:deazaflavin-dependent oxidoreductase (nitroreductase family)
MSDWNTNVIDEFHANEGRVGGYFAGAPMILIHHVGAKSGTVRINPLVFFKQPDGSMLIVASKGGAPTNPDWYHNLVANPSATVEVGTESFDVDAHVTTGAERDELYARQAKLYPGFAEYETRTDRVIPVVALTRKA